MWKKVFPILPFFAASAYIATKQFKTNKNTNVADKRRNLRIGIIGGSLSGLFVGRALKSIGYDVHIFERRNNFMTGGGITVTSPLMGYVDKYNIFPQKDVRDKNFLPTITTSTINNESNITQKVHPETVRLHTSYDCLYYNLLNKSLNSNYNKGKNLKNIKFNKNVFVNNEYLMKIEFDDGTSFDCDLVIGADGVGSKTRNFIKTNQSKQIEYAGYVAWRGIVEGKDVDKRLQLISDWRSDHQWVLFHGDNTQYLNYIVPNYHNDDNKYPNNPLYNWVWYVKYTPDEIKNASFLIDKNNKLRKYSMPKGLLSKTSLLYVDELADDLLEKTCADLVKLTKEPFYQVICDYKCNKMAEYIEQNGIEGGIILIGDAAFVVRPHITKATSKAAGDAMAIQKYLLKYKNNEMSLKEALHEFNKERMIEGIDLSDKSIELGNKVVLQTKDREFNQEYVRSSQ